MNTKLTRSYMVAGVRTVRFNKKKLIKYHLIIFYIIHINILKLYTNVYEIGNNIL